MPNLTEKELEKMILKMDKAYFNSDHPIVDDNSYDILKEKLREKNPNHPLLKKVGASVDVGKNKIKLPIYMGSLDKINNTGESSVVDKLNRFINKSSESFVISDKLDGISGLLVDRTLCTRGDGFVGQDISHVLPYLNIPSIKKNVMSKIYI